MLTTDLLPAFNLNSLINNKDTSTSIGGGLGGIGGAIGGGFGGGGGGSW